MKKNLGLPYTEVLKKPKLSKTFSKKKKYFKTI